MEFIELTKEEEGILRAFCYIWSKRIVSGFNINKIAPGTCLIKFNNKWVSFDYIHGNKYNYYEYDNLFLLCMHYLKILKQTTNYDGIQVFPLILKKILNNDLENEDEFDKLSDEEQKVLSIFLSLMEELGDLNRHVIYPNKDEIDNVGEMIQIYKKGNRWLVYVLERNIKTGYREFDNLIDACNYIFNGLEKSHADYCHIKFPLLIKETLATNKKIK